MKSSARLLPWVLAWLLASCAADSDAGKSTAASSTHKTLSQRLNEKNGYKQDANGNWVPQSNQRSAFESKGKNSLFQGEHQKKAYQTGTYEKKSWWGNKDYGKPQYTGNTDGSQFQKSSRFNGQGAREAGTAANIPGPYQTGTYATHAAREAGQNGFTKASDSRTHRHHKEYEAPEVIDWKQQRAISLDQSKGILGH